MGLQVRNGEEVIGGRAARTRIRATASRRKIVPSVHGRRKTRRHSATATSPLTAQGRRGVHVTIDHRRINRAATDRGAASRLASGRKNLMRANHGPIDLHPRTIAPGRPSRRAPALSGNRGLERHLMIDPGARSRPAWYLTPIGRGGISRWKLRAVIGRVVTSSVYGAESLEGASLEDSAPEQRANVSPRLILSAPSLPGRAIKSRGRNDRSVPLVRPEPTRASAGTMSRRITTDARRQHSERRQREW